MATHARRVFLIGDAPGFLEAAAKAAGHEVVRAASREKLPADLSPEDLVVEAANGTTRSASIPAKAAEAELRRESELHGAQARLSRDVLERDASAASMAAAALGEARRLLGGCDCRLLVRDPASDAWTAIRLDARDAAAAHGRTGTPRETRAALNAFVEANPAGLRLERAGESALPDALGVRTDPSYALLACPVDLRRSPEGLFVATRPEPAFAERDTEILRALGTVVALGLDRLRYERDRLHLESQLHAMQKSESLGELACGVAHDFNNLLMGILGNADLVLMDLPDASALSGPMREIVGASRRAADVCKQMLAYAGHGRLTMQRAGASEMADGLRSLLRATIRREAELRFELADDLPQVDCDVAQLRHVVLHLATNASESLPEQGGEVVLATRLVDLSEEDLESLSPDSPLSRGRYVCIEVRDEGCGMDEATLRRVFDPFFTTKFTGRGLGMAAAQGIARSHGGDLIIESDEGRGTTARLILPPADSEEGAARPAARGWAGAGRLLVVEDEPLSMNIMQNILERAGFETQLAWDGQEAIDLFRRDPDAYRGVLLDLKMPHVDGREALEAMREIRPDLPAVLTTGYTAEQVLDDFPQESLAGFLQKPFQYADAVGVLRAAFPAPKDDAQTEPDEKRGMQNDR